MVSIALFSCMILSKKSATFWDYALAYGNRLWGAAHGVFISIADWSNQSLRPGFPARLGIRPGQARRLVKQLPGIAG
jgi:hypothetical protein